jgi:hypothetical protein
MMSDDTHTYDVPIKDADHALFCLREAQRRYAGKLITDDHGMYVVEDGDGITHTDDVLRALSVCDAERQRILSVIL